MTDLISPPLDRLNQLLWARQVLMDFSRPETSNVLGAEQIKAVARQILRENQPLHPAPSPPYPPSPLASEASPPPKAKRPPPKRRRQVPGKANQPPRR